LARIDGDEVKLRQTQKHLRDALEEARQRLAESERADERERLAKNAEKAKAVAERFAERQRKIDKAFAVISEESIGSMSDITTLNQLGFNNPRSEQYRVLGTIAADTALMFTPFKRQHTPPSSRKSFSELGDGWCAPIFSRADGLVGKGAEEAA
jgi:hypothetical protein